MKGTRGRSRTDSDTRGPASAAVVFAVLAGVVVLVAGAALLLVPDPRETPTPATSPAAEASSPDLSLTDEQAIERFKELDRARIDAFEERDRGSLADVFVPRSPDLKAAHATVRKLEKDGVFMRHVRYDVTNVELLKNTPDEVVIEQRVLFDIRFVDSDGADVTTAGGAEVLRVRWTMTPYEGEWLIASGEVVGARDVDRA